MSDMTVEECLGLNFCIAEIDAEMFATYIQQVKHNPRAIILDSEHNNSSNRPMQSTILWSAAPPLRLLLAAGRHAPYRINSSPTCPTNPVYLSRRQVFHFPQRSSACWLEFPVSRTLRVTSVYMFKHFLVLYANWFKHFHTQFKNDIQTKRVLQGLENILCGENSFSESTLCFKI